MLTLPLEFNAMELTMTNQSTMKAQDQLAQNAYADFDLSMIDPMPLIEDIKDQLVAAEAVNIPPIPMTSVSMFDSIFGMYPQLHEGEAAVYCSNDDEEEDAHSPGSDYSDNSGSHCDDDENIDGNSSNLHHHDSNARQNSKNSGTSVSQKGTKREPVLEEFENEDSFKAAWDKWRDDRDNNNLSVKRSRQRAKLKKLQSMKSQAKSNKGRPKKETIESQLEACKVDLTLLVRKIKNKHLTATEQKRVSAIIDLFDELPAPSNRRLKIRQVGATK